MSCVNINDNLGIGCTIACFGETQNTETKPSFYKTMTHSLDTVEPPLGRHPRVMLTGSECSLGNGDWRTIHLLHRILRLTCDSL